jgi:hypothetical protein
MDNKLPEKIYAWNYCGSFNTGLGLPVVDMGDTPWAIYTRSQPKYKRVDLETLKRVHPIRDRANGVYSSASYEVDGYNRAIDDIKAKYGDLYVLTKEGEK